jgi:hypothetical protein
MNNRERTINYLIQNRSVLNVAEATELISSGPEAFTQKLSPRQRRRIQHKRAGEGSHFQRQRATIDARETRRALHWAELTKLVKPRVN